MIKNEGKLFTRIVCETEQDWLDVRTDGIGGSDVAAIMGLSPWKSPVEVWMEKTKRTETPDLSGKEAVAMGTELEQDVLDMYKRRHPKSHPRRVNAILQSTTRPWARASLDGICYDRELGTGVLEIKTGSSERDWKDGVPIHYQTQVLHYLSVTGYPFADVVALIGDYGLHYHEYRILRDEGDIQAVNEDVDTFWYYYVQKDEIPPTITALPSEGKALYELYKRADGEMTPDEGMHAEDLANELDKILTQTRDLNETKTTITNELKRLVNEHKGIITHDHVITWVRSEKRDSGIRLKRRD